MADSNSANSANSAGVPRVVAQEPDTHSSRGRSHSELALDDHHPRTAFDESSLSPSLRPLRGPVMATSSHAASSAAAEDSDSPGPSTSYFPAVVHNLEAESSLSSSPSIGSPIRTNSQTSDVTDDFSPPEPCALRHFESIRAAEDLPEYLEASPPNSPDQPNCVTTINTRPCTQRHLEVVPNNGRATAFRNHSSHDARPFSAAPPAYFTIVNMEHNQSDKHLSELIRECGRSITAITRFAFDRISSQGFNLVTTYMGQGFRLGTDHMGQGFRLVTDHMGQGFRLVTDHMGQGADRLGQGADRLGQGADRLGQGADRLGQGFRLVTSHMGQGFRLVTSHMGQGFRLVTQSYFC